MSATPVTRRSALDLARLAARRGTLRVKAWQRWRHGAPGDAACIGAGERIPFRCNVCGTGNDSTLAGLDRESITCSHCGSSVRFRAMVYLVTKEMLGATVALPSLRPRKDIAGIGMSDAQLYAKRLADKFSYVNSFYHTEPHLDIANIDASHVGRYDFIVSSDVFEHVVPPVSRAFVNARRMLKPNGRFIFTVPFTLEPNTLEHYPDLHEFTLVDVGGQWTLSNRTRAGAQQVFTDLVFHGGPGSTLEMRLFSQDALKREFIAAGFSSVRVANESYLPFGIHWPNPWSVPMVAYA